MHHRGPHLVLCFAFSTQRHETFKTQWRAMFVVNCHVDERALGTSGAAAGRAGGMADGEGPDEGAEGPVEGEAEAGGEVLQAVTCASCGASVGVRDQDEVYHFFGVLPSV